MDSSKFNLMMIVIGFVVSTMLIVFVCTLSICARIQLNISRKSFRVTSRSNLSMMEQGCHDLQGVAVTNFLTRCTICLAEYQGEDILRILPYCGHSFHVACIDLWLQQNSTCPVCRISLREFPYRKRLMQPLFSSALRPHNGIESFDTHHYHCMMTDNGSSSRASDNHGVNHTEEVNFPSDGGVAVTIDNISCLNQGDFIKDEGKKHVENPTNFQT